MIDTLQSPKDPSLALASCVRDEPLGPKTTLGVGGAARFYAEPPDREALCAIVQEAKAADVPIFVLGRGSNLLVMDEGYPGLVLRLHGPLWKEITLLDTERFQVMGGTRLKAISLKAAALGWSGFEFLEGIPGSLGGALRMNAGAMGACMADCLESLEFMDGSGTIHFLEKSALNFHYRSCEQLKEGIILSAILRKREQKDPATVYANTEAYALKRKQTQPRAPSAGCAFKNPSSHPAGWLIDQCGLKGLSLGNAKISDLHANFLINTGSAKSQEVIDLVRHVRNAVLEDKGIALEPELMIMGGTWGDLLTRS